VSKIEVMFNIEILVDTIIFTSGRSLRAMEDSVKVVIGILEQSEALISS
jgi:hypothetical protein